MFQWARCIEQTVIKGRSHSPIPYTTVISIFCIWICLDLLRIYIEIIFPDIKVKILFLFYWLTKMTTSVICTNQQTISSQKVQTNPEVLSRLRGLATFSWQSPSQNTSLPKCCEPMSCVEYTVGNDRKKLLS